MTRCPSKFIFYFQSPKTHTHTQLSRAIEEGFITHEGSVDSLLVISEDPADLVEKLCSKWRDSHKQSDK